MLIDREFSPEELRSRLLGLGYTITDEREVQNGRQFICGKDASAICYDNGTVLPQGREQAKLIRLLREDGGECDAFTRNRVLIPVYSATRVVHRLVEYLKPLAIVGVPLHLREASLEDHSQSLNRHRPMCQAVLFVGTKTEFSAEGAFAGPIRDMGLIFRQSSLLAWSFGPIEHSRSCLRETELIVSSHTRLISTLPKIVSSIERKFDHATATIVRKARRLN